MLNVTNGNVIDVGYAGVIGADRLLHGEALYGAFPPDNEHGDTYGPLAYAAYVPFVLALPLGRDAGTICRPHTPRRVAFDLACARGMWLAGRRLGGPPLGLLLAYLWLACPFTLLVANSGANDALVARARPGARSSCSTGPRRGARWRSLAGLTKFAPLALVPLFVTLRARGRARSLLGARRSRSRVLVLGLVALGPAASSGSGTARWASRPSARRRSPSGGSTAGSTRCRRASTVAAAALAVAVAFVPRSATRSRSRRWAPRC